MAEQGEFDAVDASDRDTLSMSVTVDISGMDDQSKEIFHALADIYEQNFQENLAYGFSFVETGREVAMRDGGNFDNPTRATANGLFHRTGDKRSRFYRRMFNNVEDGASDSVGKTAAENANYWFLMALIVDNPDMVSHFLSDE